MHSFPFALWKNLDTESEQIEFAVVENIFERKANNFVKLHFENDSVTCTTEHPFFVSNSWVQAKELQAGDLLLNANGESVSVTSVLQYSTDTATAVYNLEASGNHNFYVLASGVLVHNCESGLFVLLSQVQMGR